MKRGKGLTRKTPLRARCKPVEAQKGDSRAPAKARPCAIRRKLRALERFRLQFHSEEFVRFVRGLPCSCGCGKGPCQVCHDPSRAAGGTWMDTHPLTEECHREFHSKGTETFWASRNRTREKANRETQEAWLRSAAQGG